MTISLEDRVRELERFRFTMIGPSTHYAPHGCEVAEASTFLDVGPAHLDLVDREYRDALDKLTGELVRLARIAKPTQEPPAH